MKKPVLFVAYWNDPAPIEGNDYRITSMKGYDEAEYEDDLIEITYNGGSSEAEVFKHEITFKTVTPKL